MAFLRNLLATITGLFIFSIIGFFILIGIIGALSASSEAVPSVSENSILHLDLSGVVMEKAVEDPLQEVLVGGPSPLSLLDLLYSIEAAKEDGRIKGIYLEPQSLTAGTASLQEIRDALLDFKTSGKFIYSYAEYMSEGDYYLASVSDSIFLNPEGSLEFNGLVASVVFFKGLFDKLDIEPEIFRVGEFKSAVEPFLRKDMSEENRLQLNELVESVYGVYLDNVSGSLGKDIETLRSISDKMVVRSPEDALENGLISGIAYEDEVLDLLKSEVGVSDDKDFKSIKIRNYIKAAELLKTYSRDQIAVIVANGDIVMGEVEEAVGGDQFAREIKRAREDESVKAIVLRVNSPGGSLTASDIIWREVERTRGVKPIIASMSDVAASGGYFISMACDTIVAQPNTITGSIGIFGLLFNFGDFLEDKLGITIDNVTTGEFSDIMTVTRSLSPYEREIIQTQVESGYETFVTKAAAGRGMTVDAIKEVAGGRVWTGIQAKERGLVDVIGSFDDAVHIAAEKAGLESYRLNYFPKQLPLMERLITELSQAKASVFEVDTPMKPYIKELESLQHMIGIQAKLPGNLQIK